VSARLGPLHRRGLPTLTEVIELAPVGDAGAAIPARTGTALRGDAPAPVAPSAETAQLIEHVLCRLGRDADRLIEQRVREVLAPVLARLADDLARDVRERLLLTLREVVAQAASEELALRRTGS